MIKQEGVTKLFHCYMLPLTLLGCIGLSAGAATLPEQEMYKLFPADYKIEKSLLIDATHHKYIVALSEINADTSNIEVIPTKTPMLFLIENEKKPVVLDRALLHPDGNDSDHNNIPNYFAELNQEHINNSKDLFLATSMSFAGGSGSYHFFDFYRIDNDKLQLIKSFSHGRMERPYFAVYKNAIYDGQLHCSRGEKHGNAYVYTCFIEVTKYSYDGKTIYAESAEQMRRQQGNRFLNEKYWFVSVKNALVKGEIFKSRK